ncbi:MAG: hypothetical protein P8Y43_06545 [Sulfurovaceae bacterium]
MATNIIKIIDSQDKVVSQTQVASGKSVTISAKEGQSYEFVSGATKRAPDEIKTTREGNNLKVEIKDGDATSTTIIEDYYTNGEGDLVGLAEDGHFYNFVPEEMGNDYMVTDLADGVSSFQALGSEGDSMSPWWLGLPLLALGAAGGGGGSGAANTLDTTAPDAPSVTMVTDDYDMQAGYDRWGADDDRGSWNIDSATGDITTSGNVNVNSDGTIVTNANGGVYYYLDGNGNMQEGQKELSFTISEKEAGSTMEVYDYDAVAGTYTLVESTTTENLDGTWNVAIDSTNPLNDGEHTLFLVERDAANNALDPSEGTQIDIIVDTKLPSYPGEINIADVDGRNERSSVVDADEGLGQNYYFTNEIILSDDALKAAYNGTEDVPYTEGDSIYIKLYNNDTGETYLVGGPDGPSVVVGNDGTWSVSINSANAYNVASGAYETLADGEYSGEVVVYEPSGNVRDVAIGNFAIDTTAPIINTVDYYQGTSNQSTVAHDTTPTIGGFINDYSVLTERGDDGDSIMERDQDYLIGTTAAQIFVSRDGVSLDDPNSYDDNIYVGTIAENTWAYTETTPLDEGVYRYQVDTMDVAGNTSGLGDSFWVYVDANNDNVYNLSDVQNIASKDFSNMQLTGDSADETFIVNSVAFGSIDGGAGTDDTLQFDTDLTLDSSSGEITGFEVFDVGNHTLTISNDAQIESDIHIDGEAGSQVDLNLAAWSTDGVVTDHYYTYNNGTENIYIHENVTVV